MRAIPIRGNNIKVCFSLLKIYKYQFGNMDKLTFFSFCFFNMHFSFVALHQQLFPQFHIFSLNIRWHEYMLAVQ